MKPSEDDRPYRSNVGICLVNDTGLIWMGKTLSSGPEIVTPGRDWQMPQGGIENNEDIAEAARRELWEETGVTSIELLKVTEHWWSYDFPAEYEPVGHKLDVFKGQRQRWVAFRFKGDESEIDVSAHCAGEPQEFLEWCWMNQKRALIHTVLFKIRQYKRVFHEFEEFFAT